MTGAEYDERYYDTGLGPEPYRRGVAAWERFFDGVADLIVRELAPRSVLDAGCGIGFLVEKLRERGVDAHGIDISRYAISRVPPAVAPYCRVGSVTEPLEREYDLIVCIEVLEHLPEGEGRQAIANFAAHTDSILFSSTPSDFDEPTHVNVRPAEYWLALFAEHGFVTSGVDVRSIAPHAVHLRRRRPRRAARRDRTATAEARAARTARRLVVVPHYPVAAGAPGTLAFNRVGEIVNGLASLGWTTSVVARVRRREQVPRATFPLERTIQVVPVPSRPLRAVRELARADAAVVFMPSLLSALAALLLGRRAVLYAGGTWKQHPGFGRARALLESAAARRARSVLVSGSAVADRFRGVARSVQVCVPLVPQEVVDSLRAGAPGAPAEDQALRVLFVGAINRLKGVAELLEALRELPDAECRLVGPRDEPELAAAAEQLENAAVFPYAEWTELREHYRWANVLALPSHTEGFPRVVFEAAAFDLALVVTPVGGIPARLSHERDALFVPVGDSQALAQALGRLADGRLRALLATRARRTLAGAFTDPDPVQQFHRLLDGAPA